MAQWYNHSCKGKIYNKLTKIKHTQFVYCVKYTTVSK